MQKTRTLDRREFTLEATLALLSGVTITVAGCGGGGGGGGGGAGGGGGGPYGPTPPTPAQGDKSGAISDNHGHSAVIRSAELSAGNAITLNIAGSAGHPHLVELSAAEVVQVANNQRVSRVSSTTDAHMHTVTFN